MCWFDSLDKIATLFDKCFIVILLSMLRFLYPRMTSSIRFEYLLIFQTGKYDVIYISFTKIEPFITKLHVGAKLCPLEKIGIDWGRRYASI